MKRSGIKRKSSLKRVSNKQRNVRKLDAEWAKAVNENTAGRCLLSIADPSHRCQSLGRSMEHHHVLSKQAHPEHRHNANNGVTVCPIAHAAFHSKGLAYVLDCVNRAGVSNVYAFVCATKGIEMKISSVTKTASFVRVKPSRKKTETSEAIASLMIGKALFIECDHTDAETRRIRTMTVYHSSRRTDGTKLSASKVFNKDVTPGMLIECV